MLLTATLLLTSTGLLTMFAKAEGTTTSPTLVTEGSFAASTQQETTTEAETTTERETSTAVSTSEPETTVAPEITTNPTVTAEGGKLEPKKPTVAVEGGRMSAYPQAQTWVGDGTSTNPYQVSSTAHFLEIQTIVSVSGPDKYFILTSDISLSSVTIGDFTKYASGNYGFNAALISINPFNADNSPTNYFINFDGNNYKIKDLNLTDATQETIAIFGHLSANSVIKNIDFENCAMTLSTQINKVAAIVAVQNKGTIENCTFTGNAGSPTLNMNAVPGEVLSKDEFTFSTGYHYRVGYGVFVGENQGTIQNCYLKDVSMLVNKRSFVGIVAGQNSGTITGINGEGYGLYGISGLKITANSLNDGSDRIGGITGKNRSGATISNCTVYLPGSNSFNSFKYGSKVGGIAGVNEGAVANCYVLGKSTNTSTVSSSIYDILGYSNISGGITGENTGTIISSSAENVGVYLENTQTAVYGGITGTNSGPITSCYASGKQTDNDSLSVSPYYYLGGVAGSVSAGTFLSNCYALVSLSPFATLCGALIGNGAVPAMLDGINPNYWSRSISGWPTQSALNSADNNEIQRGIRALNLAPSASTTISKSMFTHSWGSSSVLITSAFTESSPYISVTEFSSVLQVNTDSFVGQFAKINYNLTITLPVDVGYTGQNPVVQQFAIDTLITESAPADSAIVTRVNPAHISNSGEILLIKNLPYLDYKLVNDITMPTVAPNDWRTTVFSGTLNGNNKTITTGIPIFSRIYGSRDSTVPAEGVPDTDENLAFGYIADLNILLTADVTSGVLGSVISGTLDNVRLSGIDSTIKLFAGSLFANNLGTMINFVRANSYIKQCFTSVNVSVINSSLGNIGGLIGNIDAEKATIDNCGSSATVTSLSGNTAIGGLIGRITTNTAGIVKNSYAGGLIANTNARIVVGAKLSSHILENVYWSKNDTGQAGTEPANNIVLPQDTVNQWLFEQSIGYASNDPSEISIILPAAITAFSSSQVLDFSWTLFDSDIISEIEPSDVIIEDGKLKISYTRDPLSEDDETTQLTLVHIPTGLKARVNLTTQVGLQNIGGYYLIESEGDLQYFSQNQAAFMAENDGDSCNVKLMRDLDMTGFTFDPIGINTTPINEKVRTDFNGIFEGNNKTISNLTISGAGNVALFGYIDGATIQNLTLNGINITATGKNAACLVAEAVNGTLRNITIENSQIQSTYTANEYAYIGGLVGAFQNATTGSASVTEITVNNLTVTAASGCAGAIAGYIYSLATVSISSNINITDLNITGTFNIGGVVGDQLGTVTISGVTIGKSAGGTSLLSGTGYVGGIVGQSTASAATAKINGCTVSGITIVNSAGATATENPTGGIAGAFGGKIGDLAACVVENCVIQGNASGGIVGKIYVIPSTGEDTVISDCIVKGTTGISTYQTTGTIASGGIVGEYSVAGNLYINNCLVQNGVTISKAANAGGIVGRITDDAVKVEITASQSFANIATTHSSGIAGGIIGYTIAEINKILISTCVAGGSVSALKYAGGILGRHQKATASNGTTCISGCYVTASITNAEYKGKILGYNSDVFSEGNIATAITNVVLSTYPQDIASYGFATTNNLTNAANTFADINKPGGNYLHGSADPVDLFDTLPTTIDVTNLPANGFAYYPAAGWVSQNPGKLTVTGYDDPPLPMTVTVSATDTTTVPTGAVAVFKHASFDIKPTGTAEKIAFQVRIPVTSWVPYIWTGSGTAMDPFLIEDKYDLDAIRNNILYDDGSAEYFGGYYEITQDIVFTAADFEPDGEFYNDGKYFIPIDDNVYYYLPFIGTINGNGHTISGLKIKNTSGGTYTGLFEQTGTQSVLLGASYVDVSAEFSNFEIKDAVIEGGPLCTHAGALVAEATDTVFTGIKITDSSISGSTLYAGGIAGYAVNSIVIGLTLPDLTRVPSVISGTSVSVLSDGTAGGIAGRFYGQIGEENEAGYDVRVINPTINGADAGGLVGCNLYLSEDLLSLAVCNALVSGGEVTSANDSGFYAAGGIFGRAIGDGDSVISVTKSKVLGIAVTAKNVAGGVIGLMAINPTFGTIDEGYIVYSNQLLIEDTESYAVVKATEEPNAGNNNRSNAGGLAGSITIALIVKIAGCVAGGSVEARGNAGGVIGQVEYNENLVIPLFGGTIGDTNPAQIEPINSLAAEIVVTADITKSVPAAQAGLVLGDISTALLSTVVAYVTFEPFVNIKYSSFQYTGLMVGNPAIDENNPVNTDIKRTLFDLNKGYADAWTADYRGLRYDNSAEETLTVILDDELEFSGSNILLPKVPAALGYSIVSGDFDNFTDSDGAEFTLDTVTTDVTNLITNYSNISRTLTRTGGEGSGNLIFSYTNGLQVAMNIIAFENIAGLGTSGSPYLISETSHFALLRGFPTKYFRQVDDIAFNPLDFESGGAYYNNGSLWQPIQGISGSVFFTGNYDGQGKTITGLKINRPLENYIGFFSKLGVGAQVYNLVLNTAAVTGQSYVGVLAGEVRSSGIQTAISGITVNNCTVTSTTLGANGNEIYAGGLVGSEISDLPAPTQAGISDCHVNSTAVTTANSYFTNAGGIAATAQRIENCTVDNVTVTAGIYAAGIVARTSVTVAGETNPVLVKNCGITGSNGISQIKSTLNFGNTAAAGVFAYLSKNQIQLTLEGCSISSLAFVNSAGGAAGGIMGVVNGPADTSTPLDVTIIDSESYAVVTAANEAGGVLAAIKGKNIILANIRVEGCVGGGNVESTGTETDAVGGIIGSVNCDTDTFTTGYSPTPSALIKDCISSAMLTYTRSEYAGKLVGNCESININAVNAIDEGDYSTVFSNNYISSYPQDDVKPFGDGTMSSSQQLGSSIIDLMKYEEATDVIIESFTVKNILDEENTYNPIAIATYGVPSVTTSFKASIKIKSGNLPVQLAAAQPFAVGNYRELHINRVSSTTSAAVNWNVSDSGMGNELNISVTPAAKQAGYIEVDLGSGITISIPLITYKINGTGTQAKPFEISETEHLTLMYYLNRANFKLINNITITLADYAAGVDNPDPIPDIPAGVLYNKDYVGFMPIGSETKPFGGTLNGQNHVISGLYSNNSEKNYIGFFGNVSSTAVLSNIHIELTSNTQSSLGGILGRQYVGGLAGYCAAAATVTNCSVAFGQVAGRLTVGGLIGQSSSSVSKCFTACDVLAVGQDDNNPGEAGGLIGHAVNATSDAVMNISNSFASGSVFSGWKNAGGLIGRVNFQGQTLNSALNLSDSFFTGNIKSGDPLNSAQTILIGSGKEAGTAINGNRLYVAGTNVAFNSLLLPFTTLPGDKNNIYFDKSVLGLTETSGALTTDELTSGVPDGFAFTGSPWSASADSYPRLLMADSYSNAFCAIATVPLITHAKDKESSNLAQGLVFQAKVPALVNEYPITLQSSKLDTSDTETYDMAMDSHLTGNGTDRRVDMLFGPADSGMVTIYRNIFKQNSFPAAGNLTLYKVENSELWYDFRAPVVTLSTTINGIQVARRMKVPLANAADNYYIATERQLRALQGNDNAAAGTKFRYLRGALGEWNDVVQLTADIDLRGNMNMNGEFDPISGFLGTFKGNEFTISNLKINKPTSNNIGLFNMFNSITTQNVTVEYLNIKDCWINGNVNVGSLVGYMNQKAIIRDCTVSRSDSAGSYVAGESIVGGLTGYSQGIIQRSRCAVDVSGKNTVGGFAGLVENTTAETSNSSSTGSVSASVSAIVDTNFGIGGFIGRVSNGAKVELCFATGNVEVSTFNAFENSTWNIGVGGFIGIISGTNASVGKCFSSGSVRALDINELKNGAITFGVGGFAGISEAAFSNCYTSSSVYAQFTGAVLGSSGNIVAAGVGGFVGTTKATISNAYSSGSVLRDVQIAPVNNGYTYFENAVGGVIGTTAGIPNSNANLYFDLWNNSIDGLQTIGGVPDAAFVTSLTTDQFLKAPPDTNVLKFSDNIWSFNNGAYPCLTELVASGVDEYIRYPAVLSVVSATIDKRDDSARAGNGITMAITTPNSMTVSSETYQLDWTIAGDSDVNFIETTDGTVSKLIPIRTANASQLLSLIAVIKGNEKYGSRRFDRPCAEMLGTQERPYLVSNKSDLQHIGLPEIGEQPGNYGDPGVYYNATGFENFYNTWYSPITITGGVCTNVPGKVYFRLLSDIDMRLDVNYFYQDDKVQAVVVDDDTNYDDDNHYIGNLSPGLPPVPVEYETGISFQGISFEGNDYSIDNFKSNRPFLYGVSALSDIRDVSFNNLDINTNNTAEVDDGTALVRYNFGIIDGCMINSGSITGGNNVAGIVAFNYATYSSDPLSPNYLHQLTNSTVNADITGKSDVGGIAAKNIKVDDFMGLGIAYTGQITNSAFTGGTITVTQSAAAAANAGGIAGENSGIISNSFSMGSIISAAGADVIGGLVGVNAGTGVINAAYSRTNVSGGNNIGGFAGTNAGAITNAYSAGRVTVDPGATQTGIFCGTNTGTLTDAFADKAMAGKSTYALLADATATDCLLNMSCFDPLGTADEAFTNTGTAYPQLAAIRALDDGYGAIYIPQKYALLIGYSVMSSAAVNTKYSQYIDTLPLNTANPVSVITPESWMDNVSWATTDASIISAAGTTGSTGGTATLTASSRINASNGKKYDVTMPISVTTDQPNPNFSGGIGKGTSPASPYQINSAGSFDALSYYGPDADISYVLTGDVNYAGGRPATSIKEFDGHLDGQKFTVYDVTVDNNSGLFGHLNNGSTITNLGLVGAKNNTTNPPDGYIGLLAGHAQGAIITNCYAIGEINTDAAVMGGLVGLANANTAITGCMTSGKVVNTSADAAALTGGMAGSADTATVTGCLSTAYVLGDGVVGGIVGEAVNSASITNCTFAGMAMDTALAQGASVPAITSIGNIAGRIIDGYTTDEPPVPIITTISGCAYDKQITLLNDANAAAKFTAELAPGTTYTLPAELAGGSVKFAAGVAFGAMPVRFMLGTAAGSMSGFSSIRLPGNIAGDTITPREIPQNSATYLTAAGVDPIILTLGNPIDVLDVYAGLEIELNTDPGAVFDNMNNDLIRYAQPRLSRIIEVTYTIANASGDTGMDTAKIAVMVKNTHLFGGETVAYTSDVFTTKNSTPALLEDLVVSSGGIYAAGELPEGFNYRVSAQDQNGGYLIGSAGSGVDLATYAGKYGSYIPLDADTTGIVIHYTIVSDVQWGVFKYWSSLVDTLA